MKKYVPPEQTDDDHPLSRYAEMVSPELQRLGFLSAAIDKHPYKAAALAVEWAGVCDKVYTPARGLLLPVAMETFRTASNPALKAAAGREIVDLVYYYKGNTYEETISGIRATLSAVHSFATSQQDRKLTKAAQSKLTDLHQQEQSLCQPL